jgi:hypothetical protein
LVNNYELFNLSIKLIKYFLKIIIKIEKNELQVIYILFKYYLSLNVSTNLLYREVNALFDYDAIERELYDYNINEDCLLMKDDYQLFKVRNKNTAIDAGAEFIGEIIQGNDYYEIHMNEDLDSEANIKQINDKPWMVIKQTFYENDEGYKLKEGDFIKFGKILFRVREIKIKDSPMKLVNNNQTAKLKDRTFGDNLLHNNLPNISALSPNLNHINNLNSVNINNNTNTIKQLLRNGEPNTGMVENLNNEETLTPLILNDNKLKK